MTQSVHASIKKEGSFIMLETLVENQIIFYAMGAGAAIGVLSKLIAHFTLRRMVKAASRMSKSNHKLMRLVR